MTEVPDHLVPTDGLANVKTRISKMEVFPEGGGGMFTVELLYYETNADPEEVFGKLQIPINAREGRPMADMFARAHEYANDVLRQLLYVNDASRMAYESEVAAFDQKSTRQSDS